jgi:hypothetical protein
MARRSPDDAVGLDAGDEIRHNDADADERLLHSTTNLERILVALVSRTGGFPEPRS